MWIPQAGILVAAAVSSSLFAAFVLPTSQGANAASVRWDGGGDGVNWSDCRNWTADSCPSADSNVTLGSGSDVYLDSSVILKGSRLTIDPGAMLNILSGVSLKDDSHDSIMANSGTMIVSAGALISWTGQISNSVAGSINNKGVFESCGHTINSGTINNKPDASFIVKCGSAFDNTGKLYNYGTFTNAVESSSENPGTFINAANFDNQAKFRNGGLFRSNGTITNDAGSSFISDTCATFVNSGEVAGESIQFIAESCSQ